ncbi:MAG: nucleotide exchange factor GrpE [Saprospiraceae bacterium]
MHNIDPNEEMEHKDLEDFNHEDPQDEQLENPDQLREELNSVNEIGELQTQVAELKDKYLRLYAEFDNFRKRSAKERIDLMGTAAKDTLAALLPVLDDFDRAKNASEQPGATEVFPEGVKLVYHKLVNTLQQKGIEPMESNGKEFDPEFHEAITEIPAANKALKGKVVDTVEKGYFLNGKLIRFAKVVVGR